MQTFFYITDTRLIHLLCLIAVASIFCGCVKQNSREKPMVQHVNPDSTDEDWTLLFDGETTSGWRGFDIESFPAQGWKIEHGMLIVDPTDGKDTGTGGSIITEGEYGNFVFDWEWKLLTRGGNSGVKYFVKEALDNQEYSPGLEYQILDDENHPAVLSGKLKPNGYHTLDSLYEIYPAANTSPRPLGEWNNSRIVVQGRRVEHWLNGVRVLEYERGGDDFKKRVAQSKFAKY